MKSLASAEISLKASSSKSYCAMVTFAIVCTSVSPIKGDNPDNLRILAEKKICILMEVGSGSYASMILISISNGNRHKLIEMINNSRILCQNKCTYRT